ncbi:MAG: hypothetical protein SFY80_02305 [Verrucomicrobiota bacterium]|nr:hypothetical protein [Verrucomicrobiota bacterium]
MSVPQCPISPTFAKTRGGSLLSHKAATLATLLYTAKLASLQERGRLARFYHTKRPSWPRSFIRPSWHLYRRADGSPAYTTQSGQAGRAPLVVSTKAVNSFPAATLHFLLNPDG